MGERDTERIIALLEELRDGQKLQLDRQAEAITQQRERLASLDQAKAAAQKIQDRSADTVRKLIRRARFMAVFVVPLTLALLVVVCWLAFHRAAP